MRALVRAVFLTLALLSPMPALARAAFLARAPRFPMLAMACVAFLARALPSPMPIMARRAATPRHGDPVRAKGTRLPALAPPAPLRSSFASSSTPAGCLLQLKHGLDEAARGAKSGCKKGY
jgi:hypothetical protein